MADLTAMLQAAAGNVGGDYEISRSLRFNSADSAYLSRTPASAGNRKTWTWSGWVKRSAVGASSAALFSANTASGTTGYTAFFFQGSVNNLYFETREAGGGKVWETTPVYKDASAWYHIVLAVDTSQATATNRVKMYVNGTQITAFSTQNTITVDFLTSVNDTVSHDIGTVRDSGGTRVGYFNGYLTEINFIDGSALDATSFGEFNSTTGVWQPKAYTGTYGTNGFYLDFSDNTSTTTLGYDAAGSNDWTLNNFSVTAGAGNDSLVDSPTRYGTDTGAGGEVRGNYATLNPLAKSSNINLTNGNLTFTANSSSTGGAIGTIAQSSGKWYWEATVTGGGAASVGIAKLPLSGYASNQAGTYMYLPTGSKRLSPSTDSAYGASFTTNDVIGVALDMDAGTVAFYKNGVSQGTAFSSLSGDFTAWLQDGSTGSISSFEINFGQRPWSYAAPAGFKALVTTNLPDPTVLQGDDYFNTVLYTGTGSSLGVTGVGFQPDFVWIKERSGAADHGLYDAVRGVTKQLESNTTDAETTEATGLTAFGTDGFTVGSLAQLNTNTDTYSAWNWKANGAGSSNTDGTITSTVSANTTAGISIVSYTGTGANATVGHGLGVAPKFLIVRNRDTVYNWRVWHTALSGTQLLYLNTTNSTVTDATMWNSTTPTSSVFSLGTNGGVNENTKNIIAYCFAEVEGFSKFGSYTGNGSADGPFVYTGFRPAYVMIKRTDSTSNWSVIDSKRYPVNTSGPDNPLRPNTNEAETGGGDRYVLGDLTSNGFKLRYFDSSTNVNGATYIYAAFAENPFKNALAR